MFSEYIISQISNTIKMAVTASIGGILWWGWKKISEYNFPEFSFDMIRYKYRYRLSYGKHMIMNRDSTIAVHQDEENQVTIKSILFKIYDNANEQKNKQNILSETYNIVTTMPKDKSSKDNFMASKLIMYPNTPVYIGNMKITASRSHKTNLWVIDYTDNVTIYGNDRCEINAFIEQCKNEYIAKCFPISIESGPQQMWMHVPNGSTYIYKKYPWLCKKTFDDIFFERKSELIQTLEHFENSTGPWAKMNRTRMFRLFMHGPPGTGKTSVIKAIVNKTGRHIINISIPDIKNDYELFDLISNPYMRYKNENDEDVVDYLPLNKRIYIFDDMDCSGVSAIAPRSEENDDSKKNSSGVTLSGILNNLDGHYELVGAIVIVATNDKSKFDPAIYRPGRMDMRIELNEIKGKAIEEFLHAQYGNNESIEMIDKILPCELEDICQTAQTSEEVNAKIRARIAKVNSV